MDYPLHLAFKILAFAPQITITDRTGLSLFYVKQKLFKFKEAVQVFKDESRAQHLYNIDADRMLDWSARYTFTRPNGEILGSIKRSGMKSLVAAHYTLLDVTGMPLFELEQNNPWSGLLDSLLGEIPIVGIFSGYFLNPVYNVKRATSSEVVLKLIKKRTFLESGFSITNENSSLSDTEQTLILLGTIMVTLLERERS